MKKKQAKKVASKKPESKYVPPKTDQASMIVKIISVFEYVGAGFCILLGIIMLFGKNFFLAMMPTANISQVPVSVLGAAIVIAAILMILFGVFVVFLARALWNYKNWARIIIIIFSALGALMALTSLPSGVFWLIVHGAIIYFLGFDKNVVALFK